MIANTLSIIVVCFVIENNNKNFFLSNYVSILCVARVDTLFDENVL